MGRAVFTITSIADRLRITKLAETAPYGTRVVFKKALRTLAQNDLLWQRLTEVSQQLPWYGQKLSPEDWKDMFTASLRKARVVPGIDPGSFVLLGLHTSDMSKGEMVDLLTLMEAFAAERGIKFKDLEDAA